MCREVADYIADLVYDIETVRYIAWEALRKYLLAYGHHYELFCEPVAADAQNAKRESSPESIDAFMMYYLTIRLRNAILKCETPVNSQGHGG